MNCQECLDRLWPYIDGELDIASSDELRHHLAQCRQCFSEAELERRLKEMMRRACSGEHAPVRLRERLTKILQLY
ncbi:MAG TPA: mycothiol system anti-sigma-R factor [bacterium]|jgi:mycothiol system anti-sigma-R factor|nr:mycothiol system anti-sigma-R factor [bacterium]